MVPRALIAQLILLRLLDPLPSLLAAAMRTFSELLEPLPAHAALVIMVAPLLSSHPQLPPQPLAADAQRTPTQQLRMMALHAQIAQHALLLVLTQLHALALLISTGKMRQMVALLALRALLHLLDPLPLLLASVRPTSTELETELHALLAPTVEPLPRKRQSQLLPRSLLTALARQTRMEMVPRVLLALLALLQLLDPLQKLLASARPTSTELEMEMHALLAPTVEPLPRKRQSQLLPRSLLTALARRTPMEPTPRLVALLAVHRIPHLVDPQSLLLAHALPL